MNLSLTREEARFLKEQLEHHMKRVERELVRTDVYPLQHTIAREQDRLRAIVERLDRLLAAPDETARA